MKIAQSVIVITAAGSPIGKAISLHFASLGARLALIDIEQERLQETHKACLKTGGNSQPFFLDSQNEAAISHIIQDVHNHYGAIDILINYWLGSDLPRLLSPASVDKFYRSMAEGATPFFTFGKQAANYMREHNHTGLIINLAANQANPHQFINNGAKAMLAGLTKSWAKELAEFGIRVGGIVPLAIDYDDDQESHTTFSQTLLYEIVRSAEYIISNDTFNGRMIEAEVE